MRSFLTRVVSFVTRSILLAPCLLICLSCATPFPFEKLEEGLTAESVRAEFGAPRATETTSGAGKSCWTYMHEEQEWVNTLFPLTHLFIPVNVAFGRPWDDLYVIRKPVLIHFEGEKLARWEGIESIGHGGAPYYETRAGKQELVNPQMAFYWPDPPTCTSVLEACDARWDMSCPAFISESGPPRPPWQSAPRVSP